MTSHERLLEVSSRLWDRTQRSCVIRIVTVESGILKSPREHDRRHERPDADDTGMHMSVRYGGALRRRHLLTNVQSWNRIRCRTGSQWRSSRMVLAMWSNFRFPVISRALRLLLTEVGAGGLHRRHRGHCCNSPRDWRSGRALVSSQRRWSESDVLRGAVEAVSYTHLTLPTILRV